MTPSTSHQLDVPGARLHYDVLGSGPVLCMIGHPMDAAGFAAIAPILAESFTVVTYDPRGFARSTIDDPDQDGDPDLLADDVRRVLEAVGSGPAIVFGSSGGAVTGLALVTRFPSHVATLVAHEPPLALLLPDADAAAAAMHGIYDAYRTSGTPAAWRAFSSFTGLGDDPDTDDGDREPPTAEERAMHERFFGHGLLPIALYRPDLAALVDAPSRIIVAGGADSTGEFAHRTADALADRLATRSVDFPGGHVGFLTHPAAFAETLVRTLG